MSRICFLLNSHWEAARGGAEYQAHLLAEHFASSSEHEVVYLANHTPVDLSASTYEIRKFSGPQFPGRRKFGSLINAPALYRELRTVAPNAIIHMVASAYTGVAAWYAKRSGIPFYFYLASDMDVTAEPNVGVRGPIRRLDRRAYFYGLDNATHVIAQTHRQREILQRTRNKECSIVVPNFLPLPGPAERKTDSFNVAWIANVKKLKRPELFVELAQSCAGVKGMKFRMAGRGTDQQLVHLIRKAATDLPNFVYHGELTLEEVEQELGDADVFVNTSDYEGFPNTFIQAWLQSVPVLSLNVDPDGVMAKHDIGAVTGGIPNMRVQLLALFEDRAKLQDMGGNALRYATRFHSMRNADTILEHVTRQLNSIAAADGKSA